MTPKQRVLTALRHQEPDRVPTGEFATDYCMVEKVLGRETFWRGKHKEIRAYWDGRRDEVVDSQKHDLVEFTRRLELDMVPVNLVLGRDTEVEKPRQLDERTWEDSRGNVLRYSELTHDIMLLKAGSPKAPPKRPPADDRPSDPWRPDDSELELVRHVVKELGDTHFIFARPGGRPGVSYPSALNVEPWALRMADDPEGMARDCLRGAQRMTDLVRPFLEEGVDAVAIGTDFGHNHGPFMSPQTFKQVFFPAMREQCQRVHGLGLPVLFHSCGDNRLILDQMVEAGMDAYQAIQPMEDIADLKRRYGNRLALWGGVDSHALCGDTPGEIRRQTRHALRHCAPGGGFILGSSHSIMVAAKYDNYMAMLDTLRAEGNYPIAV